jgi:hypothetical protein
MRKKSVLSCILMGTMAVHAEILVEEHFATAADTTNNVPGWTAIVVTENATAINEDSELVTGGLGYGTTVTGLEMDNDAAKRNNRFIRSLNTPVNFPEGTTLYFSALVKGCKRANFGLAKGGAGTSFPDVLISIGIQPQISGSEVNSAQLFTSSVWLGSTETAQYHGGAEVEIPINLEAQYVIIGKMVNNPGTADEIRYHVIDLSSTVDVPSAWTDSALTGAVGVHSRTDYDFGGNQVFTDFVINLQNQSGLDEIYIGTSYLDVIRGKILRLFFISLNEKHGVQVSSCHTI